MQKLLIIHTQYIVQDWLLNSSVWVHEGWNVWFLSTAKKLRMCAYFYNVAAAVVIYMKRATNGPIYSIQYAVAMSLLFFILSRVAQMTTHWFVKIAALIV